MTFRSTKPCFCLDYMCILYVSLSLYIYIYIVGTYVIYPLVIQRGWKIQSSKTYGGFNPKIRETGFNPGVAP